MIEKTHFILYVRSQDLSRAFYERTLNAEPILHVPGMTEFELGGNAILGLMPERGAARLLGPSIGDPSLGSGIPRAEIYLVVTDPEAYHHRALEAGAREISALAPRDWGDDVAYSADPDGHILAFARRSLNADRSGG